MSRCSPGSRLVVLLLGPAALALPGCGREARPPAAGPTTTPPPRSADRPAAPADLSTIAVPVGADLDALARGLDAAIPRTLWAIDRRVDRCIPPQRVALFGARVKLTGAIPCTLSGEAVRGRLTLRGQGRELIADIPIDARITARDVNGRLKGETATGSARVEARITLDLARDWTPRGTARLHYDWTVPPGIDLLGQRITFVDQADRKLRPLMRELERRLPAELARLRLREKAERVWRSSFTIVSLNADRPPVWMRIGPRRILYGGYAVEQGRLRLDLGLEAVTETFVGRRPPDPAPVPLPDLVREDPKTGLSLFVPVRADYAELEPIVLRALAKRAQRPFVLPGVGPVTARFERLTAYGTSGRRIAVGIDLAAHPSGRPGEVTRGRIWLTARPVNAPGSARLAFADLAVAGDTDRLGGDLLLALGNSPGVSALIAGALQQNLTHDLDRLVARVRAAVAERRIGDFVVQARVDRVETGVIQAAGDGVHLPVRATGTARIAYRPAARGA